MPPEREVEERCGEGNWREVEVPRNGKACADCHENVHGDEFAEAGVTDCKRCHVSEDWYPSKFDHSKTSYPLDGKHVSVDCKKCHKPDPDPTKKVPSFKLPKHECRDCHQ